MEGGEGERVVHAAVVEFVRPAGGGLGVLEGALVDEDGVGEGCGGKEGCVGPVCVSLNASYLTERSEVLNLAAKLRFHKLHIFISFSQCKNPEYERRTTRLNSQDFHQ